MKKFYLFTIIFITGVVLLFSQDSRPIDGTIWRRMKYENKFYYLLGFYRGLNLFQKTLQENFQDSREKDPFLSEPFYLEKTFNDILRYDLRTNKFEIKELAEALDLFYLNNHYALIDVPTAIKIILARRNGKAQLADLWTEEALHKIFK